MPQPQSQQQSRPQPQSGSMSCWYLQCVCGFEIKTPTRIFQCPNCGRQGEIQPAGYRPKPPDPTVTGKMEAEDRGKV